MTWDWERLRQKQQFDSRYGYSNTGRFERVEKNHFRERRRKAIRNIIVLSCFIIIFPIVVFFMRDSIETSKDKTLEAFDDFKEAVQTRQVINSNDSYETCIDGKKVVIVNGTTYYAGDVDTWGDVTTIECE